MSEFPPGVVGIMAQDTARFSLFAASLSALQVPQGSFVKWIIGHNIAGSCNDLVRTMLATKEAEWLWILGDDHVFNEAILMRLLGHDVDIVAPLVLTRMPPYQSVAFTGWQDEEAGSKMRWRINLNDHPHGGLVPVQAAGSAGLLVRREVFEKMDDPWFEVGQLSTEQIGEDLYFCDKARDAGYDVHLDLDSPLGHCTTATVWPVNEPGGWTYGFGFMGGLKITMPPDAWQRAENARELAQVKP